MAVWPRSCLRRWFVSVSLLSAMPSNTFLNRLFLVTVLALSAPACASWKLSEPDTVAVHPFLPHPAHVAKVCVIRTSALEHGVTFVSRDNGVLVGATRGPTYFCYYAEPGEHDLSIEADSWASAQLHAQA